MEEVLLLGDEVGDMLLLVMGSNTIVTSGGGNSSGEVVLHLHVSAVTTLLRLVRLRF
jgi:hypothetical protein